MKGGAAPRAEGNGDGRRVLVTGAAGFIGSHLSERLLSDGYRVWGLDNFDAFYDPAVKRRNLERSLADPRFQLVEGDVRDGVLLDGVLRDGPIDAAVHLAARPGVRPSLDDPETCFDINVRGTLSLLEAMRHRHVPRLVFASSSSVYGDDARSPFAEDEKADRPLSPYAASKRAGELMCHTYHHVWALTVHCLRYFTVYGPRQRPDLAIHKFARLMSEGEPLPVYGDGSADRDYTYVDDVVEATARSLGLAFEDARSGSAYRILNIGGGEPVSLDELLESLSAELGLGAIVDRLPPQPGDVRHTCADGTRVEGTLGFKPRTPFREGLAAFARWFEAERAAPSRLK